MEDEDRSKAVEGETSNGPREATDVDTEQMPTENGTAQPPVKHEESKVVEDDESLDERRDTTSRIGTRLVKFQVFETKSVVPHALPF